MVGAEGIEPTASSASRKRSPTELRAHTANILCDFKSFSNRTCYSPRLNFLLEMSIFKDMRVRKLQDPYLKLLHSRTRLGAAFSLFAFLIMLVSGTIIFVLHKLLPTSIDFWLFLVVFWLLYLIFVLVRYTLGGRWMLMSMERLSSPQRNTRLVNAFESMLLASGFTKKIRLLVIRNPDINSFSLSLPDGSYIIVSTQGLADKVASREREAVIAHEISHIMAGDTLIYTIMIRMCGKSALKNMFKGQSARTFQLRKWP
jgi:Zn-dependent protease with chaperone function